jgi:hypothetical protein
MTGRVAALVILALLAAPSEAGGQSQVGLSGYGVLGDMRLDAAQTFEAVSETSHARVLGAGIQVTNLWRFLFVDVAVSSMTMDGQRVFIDEDSAETATGPLLLAGVDFTLSRWVRIGAELRYRRIGGVLGSGGASAKFDEDSAGGISTAFRVSIGR